MWGATLGTLPDHKKNVLGKGSPTSGCPNLSWDHPETWEGCGGWGSELGTPLSALDAEMLEWGRGWALDVLVCVWNKAATQHWGSSLPPGVKSGNAKASQAVSGGGVSEQEVGPARSRAGGHCSSEDRLALPLDRGEG